MLDHAWKVWDQFLMICCSPGGSFPNFDRSGNSIPTWRAGSANHITTFLPPPSDFLTFLRHWHVKTMGLLFTQHMLQENYFSLVTNFRVKEVKSKVLLTYFFKRTKSTLLKFYSKIAVNTNFEVSSHSQLTCNVSLICSIDDLTRVATHHLFDLDLFTFIFLMNCY